MILAALGLVCIGIGYRLFCGLPALRHSVPRVTVVMLNIVPGAALALFGAGLFTVQARTMLMKHPGIQHHQPANQETDWPHGAAHHHSDSV